MKGIKQFLLAALLCCVSSVAAAYNPALEDEGRWVFYDSDKEGVMRFDKESITLEGDRYAYVWSKKIYNSPELLGKEDLQLMYIDCEKKKYKILDFVFYSDKETVASSARYNVLTGEAATPWKDKEIEKKANKELIKRIFDKKEKKLLVDEDNTKAEVPDDYTEMWNYLSDLSTNVWQYIGGRNLLAADTGLGESYVFYYDKQNVDVSADGKELTLWLRYRCIDGKDANRSRVAVKYGLSRTTINLEKKTYTDHVLLTYDENGAFEHRYTKETGVERAVLPGTIMEMICNAFSG